MALGTSLPDTFASKAAAVGEKNADNAIGNVTGSNSVNVFLGLGMPWLLAASYHTYHVSAGRKTTTKYFEAVAEVQIFSGIRVSFGKISCKKWIRLFARDVVWLMGLEC